jgi:hypothetical protein
MITCYTVPLTSDQVIILMVKRKIDDDSMIVIAARLINLFTLYHTSYLQIKT